MIVLVIKDAMIVLVILYKFKDIARDHMPQETSFGKD